MSHWGDRKVLDEVEGMEPEETAKPTGKLRYGQEEREKAEELLLDPKVFEEHCTNGVALPKIVTMTTGMLNIVSRLDTGVGGHKTPEAKAMCEAAVKGMVDTMEAVSAKGGNTIELMAAMCHAISTFMAASTIAMQMQRMDEPKVNGADAKLVDAAIKRVMEMAEKGGCKTMGVLHTAYHRQHDALSKSFKHAPDGVDLPPHMVRVN